jgi:hypothetical protein
VAKAERTSGPLRVCFICTRHGWKPYPDKLTCCGLSALSSVMVRFPVVVPVLVGLKVMLMVHDIPDPTLAPQSLV